MKTIILQGQNIPYQITRSDRSKNLRISISRDGNLLAILPYGMDEKFAENFIQKKSDWILKKIKYFQKHKFHILPKSSQKEYKLRKKEAYAIIKEKILYFNSFYKFAIGKITIRRQKTRWGSCSRKGNLNFNFNIIHLPQNLLNYLVVHELCHLKELNHSKKFWELVSLQIPDYKILRKELKSLI
ncbi:MAG: hypothetical protein US74_C0012G0011 [Parcubacteria group bacterium GW2011_GWA2_38_13]|nr:MAG: hypothetical protein US74_C0012G0011 [Parcubacteria group bacterium GW2011_GWA2_38_13]